jgi:hypothetical protein
VPPVLSLLTILAAAGGPSKVPFYICGGVLAAAAVALSAVGISQPTFPGKGERTVMLASLVLVVVALGSAIAPHK